MELSIKNTFWFRHFLICNRLAQVNCISGGEGANFAEFIFDEEQGRFGNFQMTRYFWACDEVISELHADEQRQVFDLIKEEQNIGLEELAQLTADELNEYYNNYVIGNIFKTSTD